MSEKNERRVVIDVSYQSLLKIFIFVFILVAIYFIRDILALIFIALILVSIFNPVVRWFARKNIPKVLGVLLVYILFFVIVSLVIILIIPIFNAQINQISSNLGGYINQTLEAFSNLEKSIPGSQVLNYVRNAFEVVKDYLSQTSSAGVFTTVSNVFKGIISFFVVIVITFYLVAEDSAIKDMIRSVVPSQYQPFLSRVVNQAQKKIGQWIKGQLVLGLIVFLASFVGLTIIGLIFDKPSFALVLALIAGLLEFIPYLGPLIAGFLAFILLVFQSFWMGVAVIILYFIIQQLENHIFVPKIMQKAVGLNPIISIVVLLIGAKIGGFVGVLLAIPVTTAISVVIKDIYQEKKQDNLAVE